jgi:hypothetical protein
MSGWAAYTTALVNSKNVSYAAIIGFDGATWATSDAKNFAISVRGRPLPDISALAPPCPA